MDIPRQQAEGRQALEPAHHPERTVMNNPSRATRTIAPSALALTLASTLLLGACSGMSPRARDTAIGATVGAVAGQVITGSPAGAAAGAVIGGVVGNEEGKKKEGK
jgi:osmotically inducible lipoprotein OsmB